MQRSGGTTRLGVVVRARRRREPLRASRRAGGLAHGAVPRGGVRDSVLHLWVLLPGAALLWGALPRHRATAPTAAGERAASAQPGRPARSPGPPASLPRTAPPPARDGYTFPSTPSIPHHRPTPADAPEPARVPRVWPRVGAAGRDDAGSPPRDVEGQDDDTTKGGRWPFVTCRTSTGSRRLRWTPPRN